MLDSNLIAHPYTIGLKDYTIYSVKFNSDNSFWVGTDMGLILAQFFVGKVSITPFEDLPMTGIHAITNWQDKMLIGTEDMGIYALNTKGGIVEVLTCQNLDLTGLSIRHILVNNKNELLISTNNLGVIKLFDLNQNNFGGHENFNRADEKDILSVRTSFLDKEQSLWIGSNGEGPLKLEDQYFVNFHWDPENTATYSITEYQNELFIGIYGKIVPTGKDPSHLIAIIDRSFGLPQSEITDIHFDNAGDLWVGTSNSGLWKLKAGTQKFKNIFLSDDLITQKIHQIISSENKIYVATDFGAYLLSDDKVVMHMSIENGLSENVIHSIFKDSKNRIWIATTTSEITYIEGDEIQKITAILPESTYDLTCFAEDNNGNIWIGTSGLGIICITSPEQLYIQKYNGLYSDYVYSLVCDNENRLWSGHKGALSKVNLNTKEINILTPGERGEHVFNDNAVFYLSGGNLLFGSDKGLIQYNSEQDQINSIEPNLSFTSLLINEKSYPFDTPVFLNYGDYKVEFSFIGISLTKPEGIRYEYILEGYEDKWSELTDQRTVIYNHLRPGSYTFKVRAYNSDKVGGQSIIEFSFQIDTPFLQKWWFITLSVLVILAIIRFIIIRRERLLRANQEYLKTELAARTKEVVDQKELPEIKNMDITDSILYAKNIQRAVLPQHVQLEKTFSDSFVYNKPRDIVSGDFYWMEVEGTRKVLACADCTGHGVPGAFMSLIGSVLLKEVTAKKSLQQPGEILTQLDSELFNMLNHGNKETIVNDGMDISLIEYNTSTRILKMAGANRPIILVQSGEIKEFHGDRHAIVSNMTISHNLIYKTHTIDVNSGDVVYMFSDGITDQFGGPKGKKLKNTGLLQIIQEIHMLPMNEQREVLKKRFQEWKGNIDQLDDIIMIGIRL